MATYNSTTPHLDALLGQMADAAQSTAVTVSPLLCTDPFSPELLGAQLGTDYTAGEITAYIADPRYSSYPHIEIFVPGDVSLRLEVFEQMLPRVLAILADPRFQAARAAWAARRGV